MATSDRVVRCFRGRNRRLKMVELQEFGRAECAAIDAHIVDRSVEESIGRRRIAGRLGSNGPIGFDVNRAERALLRSDLFTVSVEAPRPDRRRLRRRESMC